eukprot:scaffold862_cov76-Skeletonema_dohrnii-CCMP3373.AAC.5
MSEDFESGEAGIIDNMCCASCGINASDDDKGINLKKCAACNLVRYCGVECQREHMPKHKCECKKRVAELHDEILFRQPESSDLVKWCFYANRMREMEQSLEQVCPFCRHPVAKTKEAWKEENKKGRMKRVEANDPVATRELGGKYYDAEDYGRATKYWRKATELGDVVAHYQMSVMYREGNCVQKDTKKSIYHAEQAAIGGHLMARYNLGCIEMINGRIQRAVRHHIIAASLGFDHSLEWLRKNYAAGNVQKEDFAAALRAHQAAVDATKSPQRVVAEAFFAEHKEETR